MSIPEIQAADPLLKIGEVATRLRRSVPSALHGVAAGDLPKPIKPGAPSLWPQSGILAVIETARATR